MEKASVFTVLKDPIAGLLGISDAVTAGTILLRNFTASMPKNKGTLPA